MKILHCSDIHLGRRPVGAIGDFSEKRFDDYFKVFEQVIHDAIAQEADVIMISGDLFDKRELVPHILEKTEILLAKLKEKKIELLVIEGNHDNITHGKESESWLIYLERKNYLKRPYYLFTEEGYQFYPIEIAGYDFYGLGYPGALVNEILLELKACLEKKATKNNIVMVHTAISSTDFLPGTVEKETIDQLKEHVLYIAGGHFHSYSVYPSDCPFFYIPGSLEYWDLAEKNSGKGYIIYDTETSQHQFFSTSPRNKVEMELEIKSDHFEGFKAEFQNELDILNIQQNEDLIVVKLKLNHSFYIDTLWCEDYLMKKGALKAVVQVKYPQQKNVFDPQKVNSNIEEIEKELIANWGLANHSQQIDLLTASLQKMKIHQKEQNEHLFLEELDFLIQSLIAPSQTQEKKEPKESNTDKILTR